MISAIDISTSALVAQRARLDIISGNLANMSSTHNADGELEPYQMRHLILQTDGDMQTTSGAAGVKISSVETEDVEPQYKYQPTHPFAIKQGKWKGYVAYPKTSMTAEFVNALQATRAYEANVGVIEATKNMGQQTLRILT